MKFSLDYLNSYFHTHRSGAEILHFGTTDILRRIILCCRVHSVHLRMFSKTLGLYSPDTNSIFQL